MTKYTPAVAAPERDWVAEVAEIWHDLARGGKKPEGQEVAAALATRLKITTTTAGGLLAGFQSLVTYARMEQAAAASAMEEERLSVQAALAAVRPVLEARLQQRLDAADEEMPEVTC